MAILSGPIPLKIGVVLFCTLPLVAASQKSCVWALQHTDKMGNPFFGAAHKTIVAKVVGNGDIHNPAKYGAKNQKFAFSKAKTLAHFP
jgi:hypothetical protein